MLLIYFLNMQVNDAPILCMTNAVSAVTIMKNGLDYGLSYIRKFLSMISLDYRYILRGYAIRICIHRMVQSHAIP